MDNRQERGQRKGEGNCYLPNAFPMPAQGGHVWPAPHVIFTNEEPEALVALYRAELGRTSSPDTEGNTALALLCVAAPQGRGRMDGEGILIVLPSLGPGPKRTAVTPSAAASCFTHPTTSSAWPSKAAAVVTQAVAAPG